MFLNLILGISILGLCLLAAITVSCYSVAPLRTAEGKYGQADLLVVDA
jgi:hypothetical protein